MVIGETKSGDEIASFNQRDMSDQFRGPGVDMLRKNLIDYKKNNA